MSAASLGFGMSTVKKIMDHTKMAAVAKINVE